MIFDVHPLIYCNKKKVDEMHMSDIPIQTEL
jgi:hypothetical protein